MRAASAHHAAGRGEEAEDLCRKLLEAIANYAPALRLLGVIELERGRPGQAKSLLAGAFPALAGIAEAHIEYGTALALSGDREAAADAFRRAIALRPDDPDAHARLGGVLSEMGLFDAAIASCRTAIDLKPDHLASRIVLATSYRGAGRMQEAAATWREAIALDPDRADSYHQLALELSTLGLLEESLGCHARAIELEPTNPSFHCGRGGVLILLHRGEDAADAFRAAIAVSPNEKSAWGGLGWALRLQGRFEEAEACIKRLREIDPTDLVSAQHLSSEGRRPNEREEEVATLLRAVTRPDASVGDRITGGFALGRQLDDAGRYDEAFAHYAAANALVRKTWRNAHRGAAEMMIGAPVERTISSYTRDHIESAAAKIGNLSELPVFIVGMPRSGTTLVEQICASHSRVFGAGELGAIPRMLQTLSNNTGDGDSALDAHRRAASEHVLRLRELGSGSARVVDKMPDNIFHVGAIACLFPRARVVYCSRDPIDISLSCYFQLFGEGAQYFSYNLEDCGRRCLSVQRLASHWLKLRPHHMIEVNYEKLVGDLEGESRRLIEFLGLEWEPGCLDFHQTERTVATVSHWQVRQPLYASSVGRWRNYAKYLGPLLAILSGHASDAESINHDGAFAFKNDAFEDLSFG
jgi:tetratricopeptide (TPR) repeat protein